jgi:hypothetical protein
MGRFVRYIVNQKVAGQSREVGLFTAAYQLRDDGDPTGYDHQRLGELLAWFRTELAVPPRHLIPAGAVFWYRDVGRFSQRMWELAHLLGEYGYTAELVTASFVGRVLYQDEHQVAAIPPTRRHR